MVPVSLGYSNMSLINDSSLPFSLLQFYATAPYSCSYLADRFARSQVATPPHLVSGDVYGDLVRAGFRRSGVFTYRPHCDQCSQCIPVRVPVSCFHPSRSQRRSLRAHEGLQVHERPLKFFARHYDLYLRYQAARHSGGGMDQDSDEQYSHLLLQSRVDTRLIEFTDPQQNDALRMVSIVDVLDDGLSSVYTFYDAAVRGASFGTYGVLWQIAQCALNRLPYLYLGYWIRNSQKMAYKSDFRPIEGLFDGDWRDLNAALDLR